MGGRGSSSGIKANPYLKINMQFFGRKSHELKLQKKEYGKVIREIDDVYYSIDLQYKCNTRKNNNDT